MQSIINFEYEDIPEDDNRESPILDFEYQDLPPEEKEQPPKWEVLHDAVDELRADKKLIITLSSPIEVERARAVVHSRNGRFKTNALSNNKLSIIRVADESALVGRRQRWQWLRDDISKLKIGDDYKVFNFDSESEADNARRSITAHNKRLREKGSRHKFKYHCDGTSLYIRKIKR